MSNGDPRDKKKNKKGPGIGAVAGSIPMTGGALGMAGRSVQQLLDELKQGTDASKLAVKESDAMAIRFARQQKGSGRLNMDDVAAAKNVLKKMSPGEKKARFGKAFKVGGVVDLTTEQEV